VEKEGDVSLLDGRVAIVTGASKGIGRVISRLFAREGARVVCTARTTALVEETAALVRQDGGDAVAVTADASSEPDVVKVVDSALTAFGHLDVLINNAGDGGPTKPVQDYLLEEWRYTIDSCLTSAYLCTRFAVPAMIRAGRGAIVNISSMAGRHGLAYRVGYCSAKAGQLGMTAGLAVELGRHNITVNAIAPGAVEGDRIARVIAGQAEVRGVSEEQMRKTMMDRAPLKRFVTPEDIAWAAAFLCSDHARNISGQCVPVNAGEPAT
jgi:NAD(P)-dependent dehydrogenase (short-subunit alcohol dehydrogenase family)